MYGPIKYDKSYYITYQVQTLALTLTSTEKNLTYWLLYLLKGITDKKGPPRLWYISPVKYQSVHTGHSYDTGQLWT